LSPSVSRRRVCAEATVLWSSSILWSRRRTL
jgi:hypothetical protein